MKNTLVGIAMGLLVGAAVAPASAHHGSDLRNITEKVNKLQNKVNTLQQKTSAMDTDGFYYGPVVGNQVIGLCATATTAVWEPAVEDITMIDDCIAAQSSQAKQLRKSIDR